MSFGCGSRGGPPALIWATLAIALGLAACGGDEDGASDGDPPSSNVSQPPDVSQPAGLLEWMAANPGNAGLVVVPDEGAPLIELNGDDRFPLASTRKVLIAGALTASGEDLRSEVPRRSVERYYLPGSDGGAHERAGLDSPRLTLGEVASATIEVSDNAAADALLARVGTDAVDAWALEQGMSEQEPILPLLGELAAWSQDPGWVGRSPEERAKLAESLARRVAPSEVILPAVGEQRRLAASSVAGTPVEWAELMRTIGTTGDRQLIELLDWPRRTNPELREEFELYLSKGGALAGVITEASYLRRQGGGGIAIALFLRDVPLEIEAGLAKSFAQQALVQRLATDEEFLERARAELAAG